MLRTSAATVSEGMLANTADTGSLEYNTVDGTLWFVHAVGRHVAVTGDDDLGAELAPALARDRRPPRRRARASGSASTRRTGCCAQGAEGWALTWMDARIDGVPVTPRVGQAGRGQRALARALDVAAELAGDARSRPVAALRDRARDVVRRALRPRRRRAACSTWSTGPDGDDASVRPNQLLAVVAADGPLDGARRRRARRRRLPAGRC